MEYAKNTKRIRIGVLGIGHLGQYHLQKYTKLPHNELLYVVDVIPEKVHAAAERHNCRGATDHRELIGKVDAVSICVPTADHYALARDFLQAGIHVFLEKPVTVTLAEADELIDLADQRRLVLQVGMIERFNPAIIALDSLNIRPFFIEAHRLHTYQERGLDIDVVMDLMIHDLDIILKYVPAPVQRIEAAGLALLTERNDIANARITFADGCIANVTASRLSQKRMQQIKFIEPGGYHTIDYQSRALTTLSLKHSPQGQREIFHNPLPVEVHDPLEAEIKSFLEAIRLGTEPLVTGRHGRDALALALEVMSSIQAHRHPNQS